MTGATFAEFATFKKNLIRKTLQGVVFTALTSVDALTSATLFGTGGIIALTDDWAELGDIDDNGAQFSRAVDVSTVTSWGDLEPSRQDVKSDVTTLAVVCNDTGAATIGLYTGVDMSTVEADHSTGAVSIDKPAIAQLPLRRVLTVGVDTTDDGEIYIVRQLLYAKITGYSDMQLNSSADAASPTYGVTFTAFKDPVAGTSERFMFGGPGWVALLDDMGITQAGA